MSTRSLAACAAAILAVMLVAAPARADTRITYVDEESGAKRTVINIKDGKVRMDSGHGDNWTLYDVATDTLTTVDATQRSYTVLDEEKLRALSGQLNAAMEEMRAQLEQMSPEQRAAVEKMMGGGMASDRAAMDITVERTGKTMTRGGRDCRQVFLAVNGATRMELCVLDEEKIEMPDADRDALAAMHRRMKVIAEGIAGSGGRAPLDYDSLGGMPVYMRPDEAASGEVLDGVAQTNIDAGLFEVPTGYREENIALEE